MRIHSSFLETDDLRKAARLAGVSFTRFNLHGSRKRAAAFDVILTGSSPRRQNTRGMTDDYAATWDEWGCWLAALFALDAAMVTPYYENAEHFHWATGDRFRSPYREPIAENFPSGHTHRWQYAAESVTGSYHVSECKCSAVRRWLNSGTWAEFVEANR